MDVMAASNISIRTTVNTSIHLQKSCTNNNKTKPLTYHDQGHRLQRMVVPQTTRPPQRGSHLVNTGSWAPMIFTRPMSRQSVAAERAARRPTVAPSHSGGHALPARLRLVTAARSDDRRNWGHAGRKVRSRGHRRSGRVRRHMGHTGPHIAWDRGGGLVMSRVTADGQQR